MTDERFDVRDQPEESRYILIDHDAADSVIGEESYVDVSADGGIQRVLFHTGVSEDYNGQGLASFLVRNVADDIVARGYAIVPVCPYVVAWLPKHPEYGDHVVEPTSEHRRAVAARQK